PLPRWWLILFWLTIVFGVGYLVLYPGMGNYAGTLGWSSSGEHAADDRKFQDQYGALYAGYASTPVEVLAKDERAMQIGARLFANNCAACHGTDAHGGRGFPNLTDKDWLWGGTPEAIHSSILNGRNGVMPGWKDALGAQGVDEVVAYTLSLSGRSGLDAKQVAAGQGRFMMCAGCHGADGTGNPMLGAPNLTDNIWLHGGSVASLTKTVMEGRNNQMPAQVDILGPERVHLLTAYVLSLSEKEKR
ncbi:MAG: cytochrome-c oxidase, cbb3-type subunit III, partial [Moraxellaceae bacterium]|nr:cytochrome-c oxidase, cbb3-type subunit III [Moraxellaceae bacterium]